MSLTSHLYDPESPITLYLKKTYPHISETLKRLRDCMQNLIQIPPTREGYPYNIIGQAIDYRIRFAVEVPNLGHLWAGRGIIHHAKYNGYFGTQFVEDLFNYPQRFFQNTESEPHPLKHLLNPRDERLLARYCIILAHYEGYARAGQMKLRPRETVEEMLAVPWRDEVEDLYHLTEQFYTSCASWLTLPVNCNPIFPIGDLIGGADGDLIVDGCLFDFKCTKRRSPDLTWIYQMLGYVLLDHDFTFDSCGFYFARHGTSTQWKALPWLRHLAHDNSLTIEQAQQGFLNTIKDYLPSS